MVCIIFIVCEILYDIHKEIVQSPTTIVWLCTWPLTCVLNLTYLTSRNLNLLWNLVRTWSSDDHRESSCFPLWNTSFDVTPFDSNTGQHSHCPPGHCDAEEQHEKQQIWNHNEQTVPPPAKEIAVIRHKILRQIIRNAITKIISKRENQYYFSRSSIYIITII